MGTEDRTEPPQLVLTEILNLWTVEGQREIVVKHY